jgi:release factor glutamine methyltransferase
MQNKTIIINNYQLTIFPQVYEPADDTLLVADNLNIPQGATLLDLGTGCGILAILAAEKATGVIATDINPYAVICAQRNVKQHNFAHKIEVRQGNLFHPLHQNETFDQILFNPPYIPDILSHPEWLDKAWNGGPSGRKWTNPFLKQVSRYLRKGGNLLLIQSSPSGYEETLKKLKRDNYCVRILVKHKLFFETLVLIQAIKQ